MVVAKREDFATLFWRLVVQAPSHEEGDHRLGETFWLVLPMKQGSFAVWPADEGSCSSYDETTIVAAHHKKMAFVLM